MGIIVRIKLYWLQRKANHHRVSSDLYSSQAMENLTQADRHAKEAIRIEQAIRVLRYAQ